MVASIFSRGSNGNPEADRKERRAVDDVVFNGMVESAREGHAGTTADTDVVLDVLKVMFHYQRESDRRGVRLQGDFKTFRKQWVFALVGLIVASVGGITTAADPGIWVGMLP